MMKELQQRLLKEVVKRALMLWWLSWEGLLNFALHFYE
jgi:hypothetical protein